jgi:hypothetical protein
MAENKAAIPERRITIRLLGAKLSAACLMYLGLAPVFLCAGVYLTGGLAKSALLPALALLLTMVAGGLPGKWRRIGFIPALVLQAGMHVLLWRGAASWTELIFLAPCLWMMLLLLPAMARPAGLEWPLSYISTGVILHLAGQILKNQAIFALAGGLLSFFFSAYLLLAIFTVNRYCLLAGMGGDKAIPARLLSRNRWLLVLTGAVAAIAANFKSLQAAARAAWAFVKYLLLQVILWLNSFMAPLAPPQDQGGAGDGGMMLPPVEANEPSLLAVILEKVMIVLGTVIVAALAIAGLYMLGRGLLRLMRTLMARIREYSKAIGESYEDKTESLFDWGAVQRAAGERLRRLVTRPARPPAWEKLSPREAVRRAYAVLAGRKPDMESSLTAREALLGGKLNVRPEDAAQMASTYEAARYSANTVTQEDAAFMRKGAGL